MSIRKRKRIFPFFMGEEEYVFVKFAFNILYNL